MRNWIVVFDEEREVFCVVSKETYLTTSPLLISVGSFHSLEAAVSVANSFNNEES